MEKKAFSVKVDPRVWAAAKNASNATGMKLGAFIESALRAAIPPAFRKGLK